MYGDVRDLIPDDSPTHMGKYVRLTHYAGANIFYYQLDDLLNLRIAKKYQSIFFLIFKYFLKI